MYLELNPAALDAARAQVPRHRALVDCAADAAGALAVDRLAGFPLVAAPLDRLGDAGLRLLRCAPSPMASGTEAIWAQMKPSSAGTGTLLQGDHHAMAAPAALQPRQVTRRAAIERLIFGPPG